MPPLDKPFLFLEDEFKRETSFYEIFTKDYDEYIKGLMLSFTSLKFLVFLFKEKEFLKSLLNPPGISVGGVSSNDFLITFNAYSCIKNGKIEPSKEFKKWLPKALFVFFLLKNLNVHDQRYKEYTNVVDTVGSFFITDYKSKRNEFELQAEKIAKTLQNSEDIDIQNALSKMKDTEVKYNETNFSIDTTLSKNNLLELSQQGIEQIALSNEFLENYDKLSSEEKNVRTPQIVYAETVKQLSKKTAIQSNLPIFVTHYVLEKNPNNRNDIEKFVKEILEDIYDFNKNNDNRLKQFATNDGQIISYFNSEKEKEYTKELIQEKNLIIKGLSNVKNILNKTENVSNTEVIKVTENVSSFNQNYSSAPVNYEEVKFGSLDRQVKEKESQSEIQNAVFEIPYFTIQTDDGPVNPITNKKSKKLCARGAKTILQKVFKFPYYAGDAYDVPNHSNFKRDFIEIPRPAQFRNGDVYVIDRFKGKQYGHMAVFLNGNWYSDFNQGSLINIRSKKI